MKQEFTAQISGDDKPYKVALDGGSFEINDKTIQVDAIETESRMMHFLYENASYNCELIEYTPDEKKVKLKINGKSVEVTVQDKFDLLLKELGMSSMLNAKVNDLKAPMPGLVLKVLVQEGAVVKKGDTLVVLEAMKMENNIKATQDVHIKTVHAKPGEKVEKNQLLLTFQ